ncbi:hypothetical protein [Bradyrhizobium sp. CCBAU 51753]|nr:hypothetical protein [Bradyrhizobium sp. CCBAU 51753]
MDPNPIDNARSPGSPTAHVWTQEDHDLFSQIMNEADHHHLPRLTKR